MDLNQQFNMRSGNFQQVYGYGALLEMYVIGIMNFLVDSGLVKQEDLSMIIMKEMNRFEAGLEAQKQAAKTDQEQSADPMAQFKTTAPKEKKQSFADFIKGETENETTGQTEEMDTTKEG